MDQDKLSIDSIFLAAIEITNAEERSSYLDKACGNDTQLRERVERLLSAQPKMDSFLESPAPGLNATINQPITEREGSVIGPYKLLQQIGEGGMGAVYMAEQKQPIHRKVALKIIKPGMDTRQVVARFEAERQALAMMDHPNIAKVLDGGSTDSGRPFFVMELVKGVPITKYCDEQRLTTRQRLDLFVTVCQAVQHAHQKGIIHRDLKPTNILIAQYDDQPVAKVIDFGVAKATNQQLTEKTMFTEYGQIVGTLEYMSPEQAKVNQLDIDTRSDVYSLGVLLYELLTGETPFDKKRLRAAAYEEMLQILREEEPPKPSTKLSSSETLPTIATNRQTEPKKLNALIRGDLDWIVMKALEKDRTRRYETATNFAADIGRFLNDEPVEACPPSATYKFKKFARRNKAVITTVSIVAAALILGIAGTTWQSIQAIHERDRAVIAEALAANRLTETIAERDRAISAEDLAEDWLEEIELEKDRAVAAEELAQTRLENEQKERTRAEKAEQLAKEEAEKVKTEAAIAKAVNDFLQKDLLSQADPVNEPDRNLTLRTVLDRAAKNIEKKFQDQPLVEAAIRGTIGKTYKSLGLYDSAQPHLERALELRQEHLGAEHPSTLISIDYLALLYIAQGKYKEAETLHVKTLEFRRRVLGEEHPRTLTSMNNLAALYRKQSRYVEAQTLLHEILGIQRHKLPDSWQLFHIRVMLGAALLGQDKYAEAEPLLSEGYTGLDRLKEKIPKPVRVARLTLALEQLVLFYKTRNAEGDAGKLQKYQTLLNDFRRSTESLDIRNQENKSQK